MIYSDMMTFRDFYEARDDATSSWHRDPADNTGAHPADGDPRLSQDPHIASYEREHYHDLPPGWFSWNDMQKRISMMNTQMRQKEKNRVQVSATRTAQSTNSVMNKNPNWLRRLFGGGG